MSTKHKRVRAVESDEEDTQDNTKQILKAEIRASTSNIVRAVVPEIEAVGPTIEGAATDIKNEILISRDETQYVHKKNHDQATMLAILNRKLEQRDATITQQNAIIRDQARDIRTMRENALGECAVMFGQVNAKQATLETKVDNANARQATIETKVDDIKRLLEDLIQRK